MWSVGSQGVWRRESERGDTEKERERYRVREREREEKGRERGG